MDDLDVVNALAQTIYDKKGFNIMAMDARGISTLTDYFIFAEGNVNKHVQGISRAVEETARKLGNKPIHIEGDNVGDWIVIDCWQIMVHLFAPGVRESYQLESLWGDGKIIDLDIKTIVEEGAGL